VGSLGTRRWLVGALIVAAVAIVSASALVFQGRDDGSRSDAHGSTTTSRSREAGSTTTSTTSTTTSTTTSSTTTTTVAPPAPAPTEPTAAPTPVAVVPPPAAPAPACDGAGSGVIDAMNSDRASGGLGLLCGSSALAGYAQSWANWMAQNQSLTHQNLGAVLNGTSFSTVAENILSGPGGMSVGEMEAAWMASPPHHQNIMNGAYAAAGVGTAYSSDGRVWVAVDFGG
jgi:uncharacterized protein YkwD